MNHYTCTDYRLEMILLALNRRLNDPNLNDLDEKNYIQQEIRRIEGEIESKES